MLVSEALLRKSLGQDRSADRRARALSTTLVSAAVRLERLPWDHILGYGNPRREASADDDV